MGVISTRFEAQIAYNGPRKPLSRDPADLAPPAEHQAPRGRELPRTHLRVRPLHAKVVIVHSPGRPVNKWKKITKEQWHRAKIVSGGGLGAEIAQYKCQKRVGPSAPHILQTLIVQSRPPDPLRTQILRKFSILFFHTAPGDGQLQC